MSVTDSTKITGHPVRLVWFITLLSFFAGVAMVGIVGLTRLRIHAAQEQFSATKARLFSVKSQLDRRMLQEGWAIYEFLQQEHLVAGQQQTLVAGEMAQLVAEYRQMLDGPEFSALFAELEKEINKVQELRAECLRWAAGYTATMQALPTAREQVKQALYRMDEAVERAYGLQRLARAIRVKKFRQSAGPEAERLARAIATDLGASPDLSVLRREIADFVLLFERLNNEERADFLTDIRDNRLRTILDRLHRTTTGTAAEQGEATGLSVDLLRDFETALFGAGYHLEHANQTIVPGRGGLYVLNSERLAAQAERARLRLAVTARFEEIHRLAQEVEARSEQFVRGQGSRIEGALRHAWQTILAIWLTTAGIFVLFSIRIIGAIKRQIRMLNDKTVELQASSEALMQSEERLHHLSSRLLTVQESERRRIALELHDELGQSLAALKLRVRSVEKKLGREAAEPGQMKQECETICLAINEIIENTRRLSRDLSPVVLDDLGLESAVEYLLDNFAKLYNIKTTIEMADINHLFTQEAQRNLYRILQEALTNVGKHAGADQVALCVRHEGDTVYFSVRDNGRGFEVNDISQRQGAERGMGLTAMAERVRILGGEFTIASTADGGTTISFTAPVYSKGKS